MDQPTPIKPKPEEPIEGAPPAGDYEYGDFSNGNDEILIPVEPGKAPKLKDKVPAGRGRRLWIMVFIVIVVAVIAYFSYRAFENRQAEEAALLDSDSDGLTDERESELGTDPNNADTDGDGFSDAVEVESSYDPLQ